MDNRNLLTIVLTLKDRSPFTYRWMKWMNENKCPYKILIADGGNDKEVEEYLKNYSNYPNLNYEYVRYPYDENLTNFYQKFADIHSKVSTEYVIMADNDDFFILDNIGLSIDFLEENNDYIASGGYNYYMTFRDKSGSEDFSELIHSSEVEFFREYKQAEYENESPLIRIKTYSEEPHRNMIWYYIYRSSVIKEVSELNVETNVQNISLYETFFAYNFLVRGKIKAFPYTYYIRQADSTQSESLKGQGLRELLFYSDYLNDVNKIIKVVFESIEKHNKTEESILLNKVKEIFTKEFEKSLCGSCSKEKSTLKNRFVSKLRSNKSLRNFLRKIYRYMGYPMAYNKPLKNLDKDLNTVVSFVKNKG